MLRHVLRQSVLLAGAIVGSRLINLGFRYVLARRLAVGDYGLLALLLSVATYGSQLGTLNLGTAAARFLPTLSPAAARHAARRLIVLSACFASVLALLAMTVARQLSDSWSAAALVLAFVLLYPLSSTCEGILRSVGRIGTMALSQISSAGLRLIALLFLSSIAIGRSTTTAGLGAYAIAALLVAGALLFAALRALPSGGPNVREGNGIPASRFLGYGAVLTATSGATLGLGFLNRILLRTYEGTEWVAHYDNALLAYGMLQTCLSAFVMVGIPTYARRGEGAAVPVLSVRRIGGAFLLGYAAFSAAWATGALGALLDVSSLGEYAPALPLLAVILLGFPFEALFVSVSAPLQARSRLAPLAIGAISASGLGLVVGLCLIPAIGVAGAAISSLIGNAGLGVAAVVIRRHTGLRLEPK